MTVSPQSLPAPIGRSDVAGRVSAPPVPAGGVNIFASVGQLDGQPSSSRSHAGSSPAGSATIPVAQLAEPAAHNGLGAGSIPAGNRCLAFVACANLRGGISRVHDHFVTLNKMVVRKRGREADCSGLENRRGATRRGFESHRLRRGHSSNGRASALQAEGCGFDPRWLHHIPACSAAVARLLWEQDAAGSIPATRTISRPLKLFRQRNFRSGKNVEGGRKIGIVKRDPGRNQVLMMSLAAEDGGLHQRVTRQGVIQRVPAGRWRAPARSNSSKGNNFALTRHLNTSCASEVRRDGGPDAEKFGPVLDPARSGFGHA